MDPRHINVLFVTLLLFITAGCSVLGGDDVATTPPAVAMMPELPGYNTIEGQTITGYLSTVSGGATLLAGQPELAAAITAIDSIISCYQDIGAVRARVYSDQEEPLSAGAVAIADRNALASPANLFRCVSLPMAAEEAGGIQPCTASYTLERDDNAFYIIYAGTTTEICQAFCSELEGCTAH